jgi:uncharacterized protein (DUF736 family)
MGGSFLNTKIINVFFFTAAIILLQGCQSVETLPVPDSVGWGEKSPWNFTETFQDHDVGPFRHPMLQPNDKGAGWAPFEIKESESGNRYLAVSVEDGMNALPVYGKPAGTERAEIETPIRWARGKEIWYGFRVRLPENFQHIDDRVLISQFKNQFDNMQKSPLLGTSYYNFGEILRLQGDTGGIASRPYNSAEAFEHQVKNRLSKNGKGEWVRIAKKRRGSGITYTLDSMVTAPVTPPGEWGTFKIGVRNKEDETGFVKVYLNDRLVMDYRGITFDWRGRYEGSIVRVGIYRDAGGEGYPPQTIHYDNWTVVSDKTTLDRALSGDEGL